MEVSVNENESKTQSLKHKVFVAAKRGHANCISRILYNYDRQDIVKEILSHSTEINGQKTTPLIIAARNGKQEVVSVLLDKFGVDTEQTGMVQFDNQTTECATALWCAACGGYFSIVKTLVEHGANVNHRTFTHSTPVRVACYFGRLDILEYLVNHGADLTITNNYKNTCLMIACYNGHQEVVDFLLQKEADTDGQDNDGKTALHFAAEGGHLEIVKMLVYDGAKFLEDNNKMTPLMIAAENGRVDVVEYFTSLSNCDKKDTIIGLELLGASFTNLEKYDIVKSYEYLRKAMEERYKDPQNVAEKDIVHPVPAYDNKVECKTLNALENIRNSHEHLRMESLTIRERILGTDHPALVDPLIYTGGRFAIDDKWGKCVTLWLHALEICQKTGQSFPIPIDCFSDLFIEMYDLQKHIDFTNIKKIFVHLTTQLAKGPKQCFKDENADLRTNFQQNIVACFYILGVMLKLQISKEETDELQAAVRNMISLGPRLENGCTLLHVCCNSIVKPTNNVVPFPNPSLCKCLVECGAMVNAQDMDKNTPLHIIAKARRTITDNETVCEIVKCLLDNGIHCDICNAEGKTALDVASSDNVKDMIRSRSEISLKCLAAKAMKRHSLACEGLVPAELKEFFELH